MTKARILVVEDDSIIAMEIKHRLEDLGYTVSAMTAFGERAIERAADIDPDLVLMDIRLRGQMDGVEAAKEIRTHFDIPVIYLTAYADENTLQRAKLTEPYSYIIKPFEERELHTAIEIALYKHKIEKKLRESERWLATTLKSIGDAVIAVDTNGGITFINPVAEALTGWKREDALGQDVANVFNLTDENARPIVEGPAKKALREETATDLAHRFLIAKDGAEMPIDCSAAPIRDDQGKVTGAVLVFRDITERKQAEETLRQYATELEARNEELDAFAHTVAHDLRNPLAVILGFVSALEREMAKAPVEVLQQPVQAIAEYARKMNTIIDALLLLARVREEEIHIHPIDMTVIVAEAQQRLAHLIEEHQVEVISPDTWPRALGYGPWVTEVWANYLSNAIKYGGRPPRVELGATAQADGMVRFWVKDNGPGIPSEAQDRLFTPFTQLDQTRTTGHGLGLSIVRRIVEKLGGQVGLASQVDQGSVFSFTLPGANS